MSDDESTTTEAAGADAQAENALADAVQSAETATDARQEDAKPNESGKPQDGKPESKFDATQWAALFGSEDPADVKKRLEHSRTWEKRAKENSAAASEYQKYLDSQKTEQQRLADRLAETERERDEERRGRARLMAAATHDIPASLLDRIGGSTEDEINESAQLLSEEIKRIVAEQVAASAPPPAPAEPERRPPTQTRPVESLTAGAKPANERPADMDAILRGMAGRT